MKSSLILLTFILMTSCADSVSQKSNELPQPVVEVSPPSNQSIENYRLSSDIIVIPKPENASTFPIYEINSEKVNFEDFLKKEKIKRLKKFRLYDLEKTQLSKDDLEIRVWQINDLYMRIYKDLGVKESVFILKRTNGKWTAKVLRNTVNRKSDVEKQIKTNLSVPKSGWENVWQDFVNNELLTFPDSVSKKITLDFDLGIRITESKVNGIFKTYHYTGNKGTREIQHTAKILNIIAEEFNLEDFTATKKYE